MEAMLAKMEEEYRELVAAYKGLDERQGRGENVGKALEQVAQAMRESKAALDKMRTMWLGGAGPGPGSAATGSARALLAAPVPPLSTPLPSSTRTGVYSPPEQPVLVWQESDVVDAIKQKVLGPVAVCADELGKARWPSSQPSTWLSALSSASSSASKEEQLDQQPEEQQGSKEQRAGGRQKTSSRTRPDLQLIVGVGRTSAARIGRKMMKSFIEVKHPDVLAFAGNRSLADVLGQHGAKNVASVLGQVAKYAQQHRVRFFAISTYEVTWLVCIGNNGAMYVSEGFPWDDSQLTPKQVLLWLTEQALVEPWPAADEMWPVPGAPALPGAPASPASSTMVGLNAAAQSLDGNPAAAVSSQPSSGSSEGGSGAHPLSRLLVDEREWLGEGLTGVVYAGSWDGQHVAVKQGSGLACRHIQNEWRWYENELKPLQGIVTPKVLYCGPSLAGGGCVLVTSRVWGRTLTPYDGHLLPLARKALRAVHATGVLHGDVRLDNFMVLPGGPQGSSPRVVVLDFGHARACSSQEDALEEEEELRALLSRVPLLPGSVQWDDPDDELGTAEQVHGAAGGTPSCGQHSGAVFPAAVVRCAAGGGGPFLPVLAAARQAHRPIANARLPPAVRAPANGAARSLHHLKWLH